MLDLILSPPYGRFQVKVRLHTVLIGNDAYGTVRHNCWRSAPGVSRGRIRCGGRGSQRAGGARLSSLRDVAGWNPHPCSGNVPIHAVGVVGFEQTWLHYEAQVGRFASRMISPDTAQGSVSFDSRALFRTGRLLPQKDLSVEAYLAEHRRAVEPRLE